MTAVPESSHLLDVDGVRRRLLVVEPAGTPSAVLLSLHGSRSSPEGQVRLSRMSSLADRGVVVAFPQGSLRLGSGWEWDLAGDQRYLQAAVDHLRDAFPSASPIGVTGMSGGARMASRFASVSGQTGFLGAVAGLRAPSVERLDHPVRVVAFHGTRDRINPLGGSGSPRWNESVLEAAGAWADANGLPPAPERTEISPTLTRISFGTEDRPGAVTLWVCQGAGHTWPGSRLSLPLRLLLGRTSYEIDATAEIWRSFDAS